MRFTIGGRRFEIDKEQVIAVTNGVPPKTFDGRNGYYIELHGKQYPPKQPIHLVTGLAYTGDFNSQEARRVLKKLGFKIHELSDDGLVNVGSIVKTMHPMPADGAMSFAITLKQGEDGYIVVSCPALPGCHSQGRTEDEAVSNIKEAIRGYIASLRQHGEDIPNITEVRKIEVAV